MSGAREGVWVLELARFQAGPRGGMILSDLGAEVIKIEKLGGEETRNRRWCAARASISRSTTAARRAFAWICATRGQRPLLPPVPARLGVERS